MPYKIVKSRGKSPGYFVVNEVTGKRYSKSPIPKARAEAQRRAIYAAENGYVLRNRSVSRKRRSVIRKSRARKSRARK